MDNTSTTHRLVRVLWSLKVPRREILFAEIFCSVQAWIDDWVEELDKKFNIFIVWGLKFYPRKSLFANGPGMLKMIISFEICRKNCASLLLYPLQKV
jgi:hypothetical protein